MLAKHTLSAGSVGLDPLDDDLRRALVLDDEDCRGRRPLIDKPQIHMLRNGRDPRACVTCGSNENGNHRKKAEECAQNKNSFSASVRSDQLLPSLGPGGVLSLRPLAVRFCLVDFPSLLGVVEVRVLAGSVALPAYLNGRSRPQGGLPCPCGVFFALAVTYLALHAA